MKRPLALLVVLALSPPVLAFELGPTAPAKTEPVIVPNVPAPGRQGGDTIATATVIPVLPYSDTGTTTGFTDDYDEVCPYTGSTSPDVVYAFTPQVAVDATIDLCGSSYDTKVYVYDDALDLVACNDDFYFDDICGVYVSKIENVSLAAGTTYAIVIDGYGGDHGDYVLEILVGEACFLDCPPDGVPEGEPELVDGYEDSFNGGCNSATPVFQNIWPAGPGGTATVCGVAGWYLYDGSEYRDTDWFVVTMGPSGIIDAVIDAESTTYLFELLPQDCASVAVAQSVLGGPCLPAEMAVTGYPPGMSVWLWVGSDQFSAPPNVPDSEYDYVLWLYGLAGDVATEATSWSDIKSLYR